MYSNSFLQLCFESIEQQTKLTHRSFSAPLKVTKTFQEPKQQALTLYMMDVSPGMMDGDCYRIEFDLQSYSHAIITNQSSTKIHPAINVGAELIQTIKVHEKAILEFFPEPTILYTNSIFKCRTFIEINQSATLCMAEIMTCGRVERDERYAFHSCSVQTEIKYEGNLIAFEHYQFIPDIHPRQLVGLIEAYTHQATFWLISSKVTLVFVERLQQLIKASSGDRLLIGISQFEPHAIVIRIMGYTVWEIQAIIQQLWTQSRVYILQLPPLTFRK